MTTKTKTIQKAKALGASLIFGGRFSEQTLEITCEAPKGFHWAGEGVHELVTSQFSDDPSEESLWADMIGRMCEGLEACDASCEWHPTI